MDKRSLWIAKRNAQERLVAVIFLLVALASISTNATTYNNTNSRAELSPEVLFKRYKSAVVRIEIKLGGLSLGVGSGFFINRQGEIATSLHVIRPILAQPQATVELRLASGEVLRSVKLGPCGDTRGIDVCFLKVKHMPASVLAPSTAEANPGEAIVAIGHPRGLDFSISKGIVSAVRRHQSGWREVQVDAAISPGNSGGPIINRFGDVLGIVYQYERDGQNLNFAISAGEIASLRQTARRGAVAFQDLTHARRDWMLRTNRQAMSTAAKWFSGGRAVRSSDLKWMRASMGSESLLTLLPNIFQSCERVDGPEKESPAVSAVNCSTLNGDLVLTIQKRPRSLPASLLTYRGRSLVESQRLAIADRLEAEGGWEKVSANRTLFASQPSTARCSAVENHIVTTAGIGDRANVTLRPDGPFARVSALCRFETENDTEPGAVSASQWLEIEGHFFGLNVWAADPGQLTLAKSVIDLVVSSATALPLQGADTKARLHLGIE